MKDVRLMVRVEKDIDDFLKKRLSKNITKSEKILFLIRLGMEVFDVIDDFRELKREREND